VIATLRSLPDPRALGHHLGEVYGLPSPRCTLLRSLVNDVYEVVTADGRHVLKLYRAGRWSMDEIRWETGLSAHLGRAGLVVPQAVSLADGTEVGMLDTPEGERAFVLFTFIEGTKPQPPFDDDLYGEFGRLVATFHDAADSYSSPHPRHAKEFDEPLPSAEGNLCRELAAAVRNHLAQYSGSLSRGICHGDVSLDNVLVTDAGLALHDFDSSAPGYRAADFTGVATTPHWDAFAAGYTSRRPIPAADLAAMPYLAVAGSIENLRFHLVDKPLIRGTESIGEGWAAAELEALRRAADELL
jgi:Ser/Thr protein kinase RdoA (MazF antagonist)